MRKTLVAVFMLCSTVAFAQTAAPAPQADDKPPPPPAAKKDAAKPKEATTPHSIAARLQACLDIDDGTKGRLDCYDAVIKPAPKPKPPAAKGVMDCRFLKEEDERLNCFNGFAESIPKFR